MTTKVNELLLKKYSKLSIIDAAKYSSDNELLNSAAQILHDGADVIEFFAPEINSGKMLELARKLRALSGVFNALLIIYDRIDIVKLVAADGIALDDNSINIKEIEKLSEGRFLLGYHAKNKDDAIFAKENGADFIITDQTYSLGIKEFESTEK